MWVEKDKKNKKNKNADDEMSTRGVVVIGNVDEDGHPGDDITRNGKRVWDQGEG